MSASFLHNADIVMTIERSGSRTLRADQSAEPVTFASTPVWIDCFALSVTGRAWGNGAFTAGGVSAVLSIQTICPGAPSARLGHFYPHAHLNCYNFLSSIRTTVSLAALSLPSASRVGMTKPGVAPVRFCATNTAP